MAGWATSNVFKICSIKVISWKNYVKYSYPTIWYGRNKQWIMIHKRCIISYIKGCSSINKEERRVFSVIYYHQQKHQQLQTLLVKGSQGGVLHIVICLEVIYTWNACKKRQIILLGEVRLVKVLYVYTVMYTVLCVYTVSSSACLLNH